MGVRVNSTAFTMTAREQEIHTLRQQGLSHRQIAEQLKLKEKTVQRLAIIAREKAGG